MNIRRLIPRAVLSVSVLVGVVMLPRASTAHAQLVRGRVAEAESNRAVAAATLRAVNRHGEQVVATVSDSMGAFELLLPQPGEYRLEVSSDGYLSFVSASVLVGAGEIVTVAVRMSTLAIPLDPLIVSGRRSGAAHLAEFERRRNTRGAGHFVSREQITRRPLASPTSLVLGIPGVTVATGWFADGDVILLRGTIDDYCPANVFVDGALVRTNVDAVLLSDWVHGIEVYARAGSVPAEYHLNDCGAVLFWTRGPEPNQRQWTVPTIIAAGVLVVGTVLLLR